MSIDILINQLDEHNQGSILATKKFKPREVIFIRDSNEEQGISSIKQYYENYMPKVIFKDITVNEGSYKDLQLIINSNKDKEILVNLTGGKRINSLMLSKICRDSNIKTIYVDIKDKILYTLGNEIDILKEEFDDLEINHIVRASGGEVLDDSTSLCTKEDLVYLTRKISKNINLWHKHKQKLYDANIFTHDYQNPKKVIVKMKMLDENEKTLLEKILVKLKEMQGIDYKKINNDDIEVEFLNDYLKGFIFKSGTWLEMATNIMINEIKDIDQVKSGVIFLWNDNIKTVRNEVDVVAVKDSIPIFISCKDSDKYNEAALNELNVYSEKIGGERVYKILVATKEPIKLPVRERAKEMGINLVIFDGDENKFKKQIEHIIKG
ncbi:hypothetical protein JCM1393_11700 [Clostridium carnis]